MYIEVMGQKNLDYLNDVIQVTAHEKGIEYRPESDVWIANGSYVFNAQRPGSDVDLILLKQGENIKKPARSKTNYQGVPISISITDEGIFRKDGEGLFGASFVGKILNPHHFIGGTQQIHDVARTMAGRFIGDYASFIGNSDTRNDSFTKEQMTAHSIIAYMANTPGYDSYFLSYFINEKFESIWNFLVDSTTECLLSSSKAVKRNDNYAYTGGYKSFEEYHKARLMWVARKFGFGVYAHDSDYTWPDQHVQNAEDKIERLDQDGHIYSEMRRFLQNISGLNKIFF